jgi:hypothetical protein
LRSWLASTCERVRAALTLGPSTTDGTPQRPDEGQGGEIRVGGQRRLEGGHREGATEREAPPPARGVLPGGAEISTERDGDRLRLYDPELDDAFVESDTWEDIEQ